MYLNENTLAEIEKYEADFVSYKFLDANGRLQQIDALFNGVSEDEIHVCGKDLLLRPYFAIKDPFRSMPTISILCENTGQTQSHRKRLEGCMVDFLQDIFSEKLLKINLWQSFFIKPLEINDSNNYILAAEPDDKFADMRSEIFSLLSEMNIDATFHYHGESKNESVIGISDENVVSLADRLIILRYIIRNVAISYGYQANFVQNESINLRLDWYSDKIKIKDKLVQLVNNKSLGDKNSKINKCRELKSLTKNESRESDPSKLDERIISMEFKTANELDPYLLFLNLIDDNNN